MKLHSLLALAGPVAAVFRDDVSVVDWKLTYIGKPLHISEFEDRLAIISDTNSLTCVDSEGVTAWRQSLSPQQISSGVAMVDDIIVVGGETLTGYDATRGVPIWRKPIESTSVYAHDGQVVVNDRFTVNVTTGEVLEETQAISGGPLKPSNNAFVLTNGTLSWDDAGVLQLTRPDGEVLYARDEGLAHIKQALFVPLPHNLDERSISILESSQKPLVEAMIDRIMGHLRQITSLVSFVVKKGPAMLILPERIKPQFGFDQTLAVLTEAGSVYGLNITTGGTISWVYHDLDAVSIERDPRSKTQFLVSSNDGQTYEMTAEGDILGLLGDKPELLPADAVEITENRIHSTMFDWTLELPGDAVVGHAARDSREASGSVVVPTQSGDVLYKYLQPYQAVYASYGTNSKVLTLTLVDTVTGRILGTQAHTEPVVINEDWPFQIAFGEYWFVYTYFGLDAAKTMKISVAELYESDELNTRISSPEVNVWNDQNTPYMSVHTWVLPSKNQAVHALASSLSPYGASARDIILSLEHQIVTLPKSMLSTLNPVAELYIPQSGHLSHVYGVEEATVLVVGTTNSEFTYLLAAIGENSDLFVTRVAPIGEVDRLSSQFPKLKLIGFLALIGFTVMTLSPLARKKLLSQQWR